MISESPPTHIATLLLRHLGAYAAVIHADVGDLLDSWRQHLLGALLLFLVCFAAVIVGSLSVVLLTWGTPYWVFAVSLLGACYLLAAGLAYRTYRRSGTERLSTLENVAAEWAQDRRLLESALERFTGRAQ